MTVVGWNLRARESWHYQRLWVRFLRERAAEGNEDFIDRWHSADGPEAKSQQTRVIVRAWPATLLLVMSAACAAAQTPESDAIGDVRAVWTAQVEAWNRGDLEAFMAGYWKSSDLVFFSNGTETRGWQETLDRYRARYQAEGKQMGTLDFPQLDFSMLGTETVLTRGRWRLTMPDGKELSGMTSVIFRKLPEGWRIVHDHSSAEGN